MIALSGPECDGMFFDEMTRYVGGRITMLHAGTTRNFCILGP